MRSQTQDSETVQPLSFGEILKVKEKLLQQELEVSSASTLVALAAMRTSSTPLPMLGMSLETVIDNIVNQQSQLPAKSSLYFVETSAETDRQLMPISTVPSVAIELLARVDVEPEQASSVHLTIPLSQDPQAGDFLERTTAQPETSAAPTVQNGPTGILQFVGESRSKVEKSVSEADMDLNIETQAESGTIQPNARIEVTHSSMPRRNTLQSLTDPANQTEKSLPETETDEPQVSPMTAEAKTYQIPVLIPLITTESSEVPSAPLNSDQETVIVVSNTEDGNPSVPAANVHQYQAHTCGKIKLSDTETFAPVLATSFKAPAEMQLGAQAGTVFIEPKDSGEAVNVQLAGLMLFASQVTTRLTSVGLEAKPDSFQSSDPVSRSPIKPVDRHVPVVEGIASIISEAEIRVPSPVQTDSVEFNVSKKSFIQTGALNDEQLPDSSNIASLQIDTEQGVSLPEENEEISAPGSSASDDIAISLPGKTDADAENVTTQSVLPAKKSEASLLSSETKPIADQIGEDEGNVIFEIKTVGPQRNGASTSATISPSHDAVVKRTETQIADSNTTEPILDKQASQVTTKPASAQETQDRTRTLRSSERLLFQSDVISEQMRAEVMDHEKRADAPVTASQQSIDQIAEVPSVSARHINHEMDTGIPQSHANSLKSDVHQSVQFEPSPHGVEQRNFLAAIDVKSLSPAAQNVEGDIDSVEDTWALPAAREATPNFIPESETPGEPKKEDPQTVDHSQTPALSSNRIGQNDLPDMSNVEDENVVSETKTTPVQNETSKYIAENPAPDAESLIFVKGPLNTHPQSGSVEVNEPTISHAEEVSIPLDQPQVERVLIQKGMEKKKGNSETTPTVESTKSELGGVSEGVDASAQAGTQTKVSQATAFRSHPDVHRSESSMGQIEISSKNGAQAPIFAPLVEASQAGSATTVVTFSHSEAELVDTSQPDTEITVSTKAGTSTSTTSQIESTAPDVPAKVQILSTNVALDVEDVDTESLTSILQGARKSPIPDLHVMDTKDASSVSENRNQIEHSRPQTVASFRTSAANINSNSTNLEFVLFQTKVKPAIENVASKNRDAEANILKLTVEAPKPDVEIPSIKAAQPELNASATTKVSPSPRSEQEADRITHQTTPQVKSSPADNDGDSAEVEVAPLQPEAYQKRPNTDTKIVESQASTVGTVVEFSRPSPGSPAVPFSGPNAKNATQDVISQSIAREVLSQDRQGAINAETPAAHAQNRVKPIGSNEMEVDAEQSIPDLPATPSHTIVDGVTENIGTSTTGQEAPVAMVDFDLPQGAASQVGTDQKKQAVRVENVDKNFSANEPAPRDSQVNIKPSGNVDGISTTRIKAEVIDQATGLVVPDRELNNGQTAFAAQTERDRNDVALPSLKDNEEVSAILQQDVLTKIEPGRKTLRPRELRSKEEAILPLEKQYEQQELPESAIATPNSVKAGMMASSLEKDPLVRVNPHTVAVVKQVIHELNGKLSSGPTSMHLQLNPDALGAIDVEVIRDTQGVHVTFFAEQASTGKLLEAQFGQLRQSLVDSGVQLLGLDIGQHSHFGQEGGFHQQNTSFAPHTQREAMPSKSIAQESARAERASGQTSEVDYLI